jgi:hypothetical protein
METTGQKKVWTGSERVIGYLIALALLIGVGRGLYLILPSLIALVTNLATFLALVFGILLVCYVIISNRKMISIGYQIIIKKIWSALINSNPIAIMEIQYDTWSKQKDKLNENIITLQATEENLLVEMKDNQKFAQDKLKEAKKSQEMAGEGENKDKGYANKATTNAILAQRRVKTNQELAPRLKAIQTALNYCKRVFDAWENDLLLLKDDINLKKKTLKTLSETNSVFDMAKSYINGNSNERIMYEEANQAYAEKVSSYVANIKRFTEQTKDWVYNKDIQDAIETDEGNKFLSMYDEDTIGQLTDFRTLLDNPEETTFVQASNNMEKMEASTFTRSNTNFDQLK